MLLVRCQIGNGIREPYKLEILVFFFFVNTSGDLRCRLFRGCTTPYRHKAITKMT